MCKFYILIDRSLFLKKKWKEGSDPREEKKGVGEAYEGADHNRARFMRV